MNATLKRLFTLYFFITLLHLCGIACGNETIAQATKPMLIPVLIVCFAIATKRSTLFSKLVLAALFFCWLGDVLLMFKGYFIGGLTAFLIGHICYISAIFTIKGKGVLRRKPLLLIPILIYLGCIVLLLFPFLGQMKVPVIIYCLVIGVFLLSAINLFGKIPRTTATLLAAGALLFVISDSVLAINKFAYKIPNPGIWVMSTYCLAQALITFGTIQVSQKYGILRKGVTT